MQVKEREEQTTVRRERGGEGNVWRVWRGTLRRTWGLEGTTRTAGRSNPRRGKGRVAFTNTTSDDTRHLRGGRSGMADGSPHHTIGGEPRWGLTCGGLTHGGPDGGSYGGTAGGSGRRAGHGSPGPLLASSTTCRGRAGAQRSTTSARERQAWGSPSRPRARRSVLVSPFRPPPSVCAAAQGHRCPPTIARREGPGVRKGKNPREIKQYFGTGDGTVTPNEVKLASMGIPDGH